MVSGLVVACPRHVNISGWLLVFSLKEFGTMRVNTDGRGKMEKVIQQRG